MSSTRNLSHKSYEQSALQIYNADLSTKQHNSSCHMKARKMETVKMQNITIKHKSQIQE